MVAKATNRDINLKEQSVATLAKTDSRAFVIRMVATSIQHTSFMD